jgi:hypothetical protein
MRQLLVMSTKNSEAGFSFFIVILALCIIGLIIVIGFIVHSPQSSKPSSQAVSETNEAKAEASQYPKSDGALVTYVYKLATSDLYINNGNERDAANQVKQYVTSGFNATLQNNFYDSFYCVDQIPTRQMATLATTSATTDTIKLIETFDSELPAPDPSPLTATITVTLQPLKISAVSCPNIPLQAEG